MKKKDTQYELSQKTLWIASSIGMPSGYGKTANAAEKDAAAKATRFRERSRRQEHDRQLVKSLESRIVALKKDVIARQNLFEQQVAGERIRAIQAEKRREFARSTSSKCTGCVYLCEVSPPFWAQGAPKNPEKVIVCQNRFAPERNRTQAPCFRCPLWIGDATNGSTK